jgi:hypothetical protein
VAFPVAERHSLYTAGTWLTPLHRADHGQQRRLRTLSIEHHRILPGADGPMAPGYETEKALKRTKAQADYWTKKKPQVQAAE